MFVLERQCVLIANNINRIRPYILSYSEPSHIDMITAERLCIRLTQKLQIIFFKFKYAVRFCAINAKDFTCCQFCNRCAGKK